LTDNYPVSNVTPIPLPPVHLTDQEKQAYELLVRSAAAVFAAGFALRQVAVLLRRKA
jgi:hypothetical protein